MPLNDLLRVCAWCGKTLGTKPAAETGTTHGICEACKIKADKEIDMITPSEQRKQAANEGRIRYGTEIKGGK